LKRAVTDLSKALGTSKVTVKHQITLPAKVLEVLRLEPADYVAFVKSDGSVLLKKVE